MRTKSIIMILSVLMIGGCGCKTVYVPVSSCPPAPKMTMPESEVDKLPPKPPAAMSIRALTIDLITYREMLEACIINLEPYQQK